VQKVRSEGTEGDGGQVMFVVVVICVLVCLVGKATIGNVPPKGEENLNNESVLGM
jgi:hypothetical protein